MKNIKMTLLLTTLLTLLMTIVSTAEASTDATNTSSNMQETKIIEETPHVLQTNNHTVENNINK